MIDNQSWLSAEEKKFLLGEINPQTPPSPDEFKDWLAEIRAAIDKLPTTSDIRLADIGITIAQTKGPALASDVKSKVIASFGTIDETLGLIPSETIYYFYPEKRANVSISNVCCVPRDCVTVALFSG